MSVTVALSLIGSLALISALTSAVTIWLVTRPSKVPDVHELESAVVQCRLQVADLVDKFDTRERRDRVRRMREGREEAAQDADPSPINASEVRKSLRKKLAYAHFGGN